MRIFCSICKELFTLYAEVCVTRCGHLYHENCLKLWQERNPSCPQCRTKLKGKPDRVYFNTEDGEVEPESDAESLKIKVDRLSETTAVLKMQNKELESANIKMMENITNYEKRIDINKQTIKILQEKLNVLNKEKENLIQLQVINESLRAELKRKTDLDALLKATESEVQVMLSKTPVTSLAVHQLCVYVEALKHQLRKCEEKYKYKTQAAEHVQNYEKVFRQSKVAKTERQLKINKATNTLGNLINESDEENGICKKYSLKRPNTSYSKCIPELNGDTACSSNVLSSVQCQVSEEMQSNVKKVNNKLDKIAEMETSCDFDDEIQIYPGPGKIKKFKSAARGSVSIFDKLKSTESVKSDCGNSSLDTVYDIWDGRRKNPLAIPSQTEEIKGIRKRHKNLSLKNPCRKTLFHTSSFKSKS